MYVLRPSHLPLCSGPPSLSVAYVLFVLGLIGFFLVREEKKIKRLKPFFFLFFFLFLLVYPVRSCRRPAADFTVHHMLPQNVVCACLRKGVLPGQDDNLFD